MFIRQYSKKVFKALGKIRHIAETHGSGVNHNNLEPQINAAEDELEGNVTPNGKFLTFGRGGYILGKC
ncbi:hypothetical protein GXP67_10145 [Rhodocytophaga rosea]|uniref:Uncharacterized protein n=1 Tax=Rhodocytophaga rosea TaxID=2704465 RepID=A0A6C0GGS7_9BACT|nr:hypothetical protein [Rhodocytophaga rosea]QHT66983.1 hypothetical protein GXP67_10145 [Rhodocytophaga rosea]